jgi:hypothetical protein
VGGKDRHLWIGIVDVEDLFIFRALSATTSQSHTDTKHRRIDSSRTPYSLPLVPLNMASYKISPAIEADVVRRNPILSMRIRADRFPPVCFFLTPSS